MPSSKTIENNVNTTLSVKNEMSQGTDAAAESIKKLGSESTSTGKAVVKSSKDASKARRLALTSSEKLRFAMGEEAAQGDRTALRVNKLKREYVLSQKAIKEYIREGKAIPPALRKQSQSLKQATTEIKRNTEQRKENIKNLKIGAAAAAAGLAVLIKRTVDYGDEIGKTARKLGVGVESLQELEFAARSGGVEVNTMREGLKDLQARASEANAGNKGLAETFALLGVKTGDVNGKLRPTEELLADVSDRLKEVDTAGDRTAIVMKLMGDNGQKMLPMLEGGSAGLADMAAEAHRLGGVMSEEATIEAEKASQAIENLGTSLTGTTNKLVGKMLPAVTKVADALGWLTRTVVDTVDKQTREMTGFAAAIVGGEGVVEAYVSMKRAGAEVAKENKARATPSIKEVTKATEAESRSISKLTKGLRAAEQATKRKTAADKAAADEIKALEQWLNKEAETLIRGQEAMAAAQSDRYRIQQAQADANSERNRARMEADTLFLDAELTKQANAQARRQADMASAVSGASSFLIASTISGIAQNEESLGAFLLKSIADHAKATAIKLATEKASAAISALFTAKTEGVKQASQATTAATGAFSAYSAMPFIGIGLALATVAAMKASAKSAPKFARGGIVQGGIPGVDSVHIMAQQGEAILPEKLTSLLMGLADRPQNGGGTVVFQNKFELDTFGNAVAQRRQAGRITRAQESMKRKGIRGAMV